MAENQNLGIQAEDKIVTYAALQELVNQIKIADNALSDELTEESSRAKAAEKTNADNITAERNARLTQIGELGKVSEAADAADHTVKSYVEAKISKVDNDASALEGRVSENENAIAALEALHVAGKTVAEEATEAATTAVTKLINGAPEALDTLKEIADWIAEDETDTAELISRVTANERAIQTLNGADTVEGSVAKQIKTAVDAEANRAKDAESKLEGLVGNKSVATQITEAIENLDSTINGSVDGFVAISVSQADGKLSSITITDQRKYVSVDEVKALFAA